MYKNANVEVNLKESSRITLRTILYLSCIFKVHFVTILFRMFKILFLFSLIYMYTLICWNKICMYTFKRNHTHDRASLQ